MDDLTTAIHELLQFQLLLKIYHWQTRSYPRHVASDELHTSITKNIDLIAETLQGELDKRVKFTKSCVLNLENMNDKNIVQLLLTMKNWMDTKFVKMFNTKYLANIKDEVVTDINKCLYLFTLS
jgi:hypothetical protein